MLGGWLIASIAGRRARRADRLLDALARDYIGPTLEFLRPLPASAVIPVAIAIFGLTPAMALGVIGFGAIWPMLLATVHGFAAVEPRLSEVAHALRPVALAGRSGKSRCPRPRPTSSPACGWA